MTEERKITFTGMTGRLDVPSFVLSENSDLRIRIDFTGLKSKSGLFRLFVRHGGAPEYTFAFTQKEPVITLPAEWIRQGGTEYLEFSLKQYNDVGTLLINGGYMIEPCAVTAEEGCFVVTAVIGDLLAKFETLKGEIAVALETHKGAVASDLAGTKETLERGLAAFQGDMESFKSTVTGELERTQRKEQEAREGLEGEVSSRLAGMDAKLEEVLAALEAEKAVKERLLSKMQEYVDNGVEVTFKE